MTGFIESPRFPDECAYWATGGRGWRTIVTETYGGDEYRNASWAQRRGEYEIANAMRTQSLTDNTRNQADILAFHAVCMGQLKAFRFKDYRDYTAAMNHGSGIFVMLTATTFQMYKRYNFGSLTIDQIIQKPVSATVTVNGGSGPIVDYTTGIVSMVSGTPTSWTGEFDIPCRFNSDLPNMGPLDDGTLLNWQQLKVIEVRNP